MSEKSGTKLELAALNKCIMAIESLPVSSRARLLRYLFLRYAAGANSAKALPQPQVSPESTPPPTNDTETKR